MDDDSQGRRATERRGADRRQAPRRAADESLFGALGAATESQGAPDSFFDPGWVAAGDLAPDSRFLTREARRIVAAQDNALARIYRTYAAARAAIGIGLVAAQVLSGWLAVRAPVWLALAVGSPGPGSPHLLRPPPTDRLSERFFITSPPCIPGSSRISPGNVRSAGWIWPRCSRETPASPPRLIWLP